MLCVSSETPVIVNVLYYTLATCTTFSLYFMTGGSFMFIALKFAICPHVNSASIPDEFLIAFMFPWVYRERIL